MGTLPFAAYQYCEALCTASAFGWYAFAPMEITLRWNGADVLVNVDGQWVQLVNYTPEHIKNHWDERCPEDLIGRCPPMVSALFVPGIIQVWTGFLVETAPEWSLLVKPVSNYQASNLYTCFEAIVETDIYGPWPLFTNIRLNACDLDITIPTIKPLFQVQPISRSSYSKASLEESLNLDFLSNPSGQSGLTEKNWDGFRKTIRPLDPLEGDHATGQYAVQVRRRPGAE
jgi:Family of unknown function (DUF6065)